jgi:ABC-type bacteriocin/lantibiotic exporter with double-glycine peptidase domain
MIPFGRVISQKLASIQRELMKVKDKRINTTSEALEGMKLIKLQAWEKSFLQRISGIRTDEVAVLRKYMLFRNDISGLSFGR